LFLFFCFLSYPEALSAATWLPTFAAFSEMCPKQDISKANLRFTYPKKFVGYHFWITSMWLKIKKIGLKLSKMRIVCF
jgi:hypothetical protein